MTSNNTEPALVYLVDERDEILDRMDPDCGCVHTEDCPEIDRPVDWGDAIRLGGTYSGITAGLSLAYVGLDTLTGGDPYLLTPYLTVPVVMLAAIGVGLVTTLAIGLWPIISRSIRRTVR